ncbi:MAG: RNA-directed DNA polymerase, partial [Planctomycetaceae bacterium]|nr:RNA-directed DNA polymerase [Planctomycetaceae bacterium]
MPSRRPSPSYIALCLAVAWEHKTGRNDELLEDAVAVLGLTDRPRWLRHLCRHLAGRWGDPLRRPSRGKVVRLLLASESFIAAVGAVPLQDNLAPAPYWTTILPAWSWNLPEFPSTGALANWLSVSPADLDWLADVRGLNPRSPDPQLWHYHYSVRPKSDGRSRLISAPKLRLKQLQRQILGQILQRIPVHPAAHAYVSGRSMATCLAPHVGRDVVLHLDLDSFFPSIQASQVRAVWTYVGYGASVAAMLTGLCTENVPDSVLSRLNASRQAVDRFRERHLPQGAPTSPALSNLCAYRLDCRLSGLAGHFGAAYTRYADDLIFSGDAHFRRRLFDFRTTVGAILLDSGFNLQGRKTRVLPASRSQRVGGLVVNRRLNIPRREYDDMRAILHNCARFGAESQNRERHPHYREHLLGRIAY